MLNFLGVFAGQYLKKKLLATSSFATSEDNIIFMGFKISTVGAQMSSN